MGVSDLFVRVLLCVGLGVFVYPVVWCVPVPAGSSPSHGRAQPGAGAGAGFRDDPINHAFLQTLQHTPEYVPPAASLSSPWRTHASLGSYLSTRPLSAVDIPIPIYIYTVGLDGTGSLGVNLSRAQLSSWLSHLSHSLDHVLVTGTDTDTHTKHAQSQAQTQGHGQGHAQGQGTATTQWDAQAVTLRYRYSYHVVELSELVTAVLERVVAQYHRKLDAQTNADEDKDKDRGNSNSMVQVDADRMNTVLESLLQHLQLQHYGYHVFVVNPKLSAYGYRSGFSNAEIDQLLGATSGTAHDPALLGLVRSYVDRESAAAQLGQQAAATDSTSPPSTGSGSLSGPIPEAARQGYKTPSSQHPMVVFVDRTVDSRAWAQAYLAQPFTPGPESLLSYFEHLMSEPNSHSKQILKRTVGNQYAQQDGLVDAWIGSGLVTWLDLAAGPAEWGPTLGGEGIRTKHTFPSVTRTFQLAAQHWVTTDTEDELSGESEEPPSGDTVEAVQAEMMLVEQKWTAAKCDEQQDIDSLCTALMNQMSELQQYADDLSNTANKKKTTNKEQRLGQRLDPWSFSFIHAGASGESEVAANTNTNTDNTNPNTVPPHLEQLEMDHFMAHLSSSLQSLLSHVVTPAMAATDPVEGGYSARVAFHLYILSNHQVYDPLGDDLVERFRAAMEQLRLPTQEFSVQVHSLNMDDEPTLAMAYTSSFRSTVVPAINSVGHYASFKRLYLDSTRLQAELTRLGVDRQASQLERSKGARDIPIFLFSLNHPLPVFVDVHYQSRALNNMVVAVQSQAHLWESPVKCNGHPIYWNLRDPVRSMVLSAARVLGGLLPIHVSHSRATRTNTQDWSWSVGTSPASATSTSGLLFSQIQVHAVHRNYFIHAIGRSSSIVNAAIHSLHGYKTSLIPFSVTVQFAAAFANIQQQYQTYTQTLEQMLTVFDSRDWATWCSRLPDLLKQANNLSSAVNDTLSAITGWRCTQYDTTLDGRTSQASTPAAAAPVPPSASARGQQAQNADPTVPSSWVSSARSVWWYVWRHSLSWVYVCVVLIVMLLLLLRNILRKTPHKPKLN